MFVAATEGKGGSKGGSKGREEVFPQGNGNHSQGVACMSEDLCARVL